MAKSSVARIHKGTQRVGDVEVSTHVVVNTSECDKLSAASAQSQPIGEFLDWLLSTRRLTLCEVDRFDRFQPAAVTINGLLAEYFEIDEDQCERERRALLDAIRR